MRQAEAARQRRSRLLWREFYMEIDRRGGVVTWPEALAIFRRVRARSGATKNL